MMWMITAMTPLLLLLPNLAYSPATQSRDGSEAALVQQSKKVEEAAPIEFREFFETGTSELKPSARLLSLNGHRARLVGFMAQLEAAPEGAFYLCRRPVQADESGGGTGDLPVDSVRVIVRSAKGEKIPFIARTIEITGILEVGPREESDGTVSSIRLILDTPEATDRPPKHSTAAINHTLKNKASIKHQRRK